MALPETERRNPLVIRTAGIYGVFLMKMDPLDLEDHWRVTVRLSDLKDAIRTYERRVGGG